MTQFSQFYLEIDLIFYLEVLQPQRDYTKLILQTDVTLCDPLDILYNFTNQIKPYKFVGLLLCNFFVARVFLLFITIL